MAIKVLMFGWEFPPHNSGGLGTACFGLTRALVRQSVELIFVLPKRVSVSADFKIIFADLERIKFRPVDTLLYPYLTEARYRWERERRAASAYGLNLLDEVKNYAERAKIIAAEEEFDLIHAHDWLSFPAGLAAKQVSGKPLVVHVHATEFDRTGGQGVNQAVYAIEQAGLAGADRVVAVSQFTKNILLEHYQVSETRVSVVHNGVDLEEFDSRVSGPVGLKKIKASGGKIVLFVGRITLQKGPDYFVRLARRVLDFEPNVYFVMAGSGDMEGQVIEEAARLGVGDRLWFAGFVRGRELQSLYRAADVYILPSVSEPFGITPLEAMASGAPVIVSRQSGVSEVIRHALKADFWDIEEMTNQLVSLLRHQPLHQTLRDNGRTEVGRITWAAAAAKCLNLYRALMPA